MWVDAITVRFAGHHVGIRCDDAQTAAVIRDRYAPDLVDDDRGDADLGISVGGIELPASSRMLPTVFHGRRPVVRTRRTSRLHDVLDQYLAAATGAATPSSPAEVRLRGFGGLARGERVVLVAERTFRRSALVERVAGPAGLTIIEPHGLALRLADGALLMPEGPATSRLGPLDALTAAPCPREIVAIGWPSALVPDDERPALALTRLLTQVDGMSGRRQQALEMLAKVATDGHTAAGVDDRLRGGVSQLLERLS